eukprot:scaffold647906_cov35-Prasinocladus_malaysianus.AAC.2
MADEMCDTFRHQKTFMSDWCCTSGNFTPLIVVIAKDHSKIRAARCVCGKFPCSSDVVRPASQRHVAGDPIRQQAAHPVHARLPVRPGDRLQVHDRQPEPGGRPGPPHCLLHGGRDPWPGDGRLPGRERGPLCRSQASCCWLPFVRRPVLPIHSCSAQRLRQERSSRQRAEDQFGLGRPGEKGVGGHPRAAGPQDGDGGGQQHDLNGPPVDSEELI